MTRLQLYVAGSAVLANIVLLRAYYERPNFYSAAVYISQSTGSLMFLINLALIVTASFGYGLQRLFYGPLRAIETEQLYDKAWFAVSETLLAMTIFRDDIGIWFFAMFLCLLAGKVWQWIGEGRVELLEQQPPANPRLFHARLMSSLLLSVTFDLFMMNYCIESILQETRPGVMVMFGFEYVLLAIASVSTLLRYGLSLVELIVIQRQEKARSDARQQARDQARRQSTEAQTSAGDPTGPASTETIEPDDDDEDDGDVPGWEDKGRWVFYLDLTTDFIKSVVYLGFFMILMAFYGIPIHIMRDLYMSVRSFIKRCNDFIKYRNATRDMNARYPDATAEELERENTCIVCREEMRPWVQPGEARPGQRIDERQRAKKLPCGHILHFSCLRSWLERQQVCPTCRRSVIAEIPPRNNPPNAQGNQGPQNQQNQQNALGLNNVLPQNVQNPQPGFPGPHAGHGQLPQQGQHGIQQGDQPNRPAGNVRIFNLGPIRIALGNIRLPDQRQQHQQPQANANNIVANNNVIASLAQQMAQNAGPSQNQTAPQIPLLYGTPLPLAQAHNPADIQADILRIQQNIIDSLRQLNAQQSQLEYIHALLAELNRLQQTTGVAAAHRQDLPVIAPLNPPLGLASIAPQAFLPNGPVLRQGDTALPDGLVLPEGWTLRPLVAASSTPLSNTIPRDSTTAQPGPLAEAARHSESQPGPPASSQPSAPVAEGEIHATTTGSSKQAEPSSLESSWSFGNVAEGSSSAVAAGTSSEGQNLTRRTATVEDAEDNGQ